jgi:hypothetical protein
VAGSGRALGLALLLTAALGGIAYAAQAGDNATATATKGFALKDQPGQHLDILLDGRLVGRYMYAYDKSSPAKLHETYKPYLHIFDAEGQSPITKGPGGEFTHHRGIFIGWRKISFEGQSYDRWHMIKGEIVHEKFLTRKAGPDEATITSLTHWNDAQGQPIVDEQRTMTFRRAEAPARLIVDFQAKLTAPRGDIVLDGDPEHAGVQYRPANEVVRKETVYVFPKEHANAHKDKDYPWVGEMNHPDNPKQTVFSAYRDYGRFGAFFTQKIKSGDSLTVKYRFLIADGEMPTGSWIQKVWDQYAGVAQPSPAPKLTVTPAEQSASPAKTPAKKKAAGPKTKKADNTQRGLAALGRNQKG